jgi:oligopeptide/dipeptide ABC transporter, ATP-binding protein, C-terminal domain
MRQRIMIAMALSLEPKLLICDEPTTALDVTIQAQVLDLIRNLTQEHGTAVLFITHDLGVIAELADRVCVMYGGQLCEERDVEALFSAPLHPYTQGLLDSIPRLDHSPRTRLQTIDGQVPQAGQFPAGCRFRQRCARASTACEATPPFVDGVACVHPGATHHA